MEEALALLQAELDLLNTQRAGIITQNEQQILILQKQKPIQVARYNQQITQKQNQIAQVQAQMQAQADPEA